MTDTSKKPKCPKCKSTWLAVERRPDGMAKCLDCSYQGLYKFFEYSAYQTLQAEIEYLKRMLADERSGDSDKDKTIRRLESNNQALQSLEQQCEKLAEAWEIFFKGFELDGVTKEEADIKEQSFNDSLFLARQALQEFKKFKGEL